MDVQDRLDVAETLARYGHVVDGGELDRLGEVFTTDVVYDMSAVGLPTMTGLDALRAGALRLGDDNPLAHHVTDVVVVSETARVSGGEGADETADEAVVHSKGLMLTVDGALRSVTHHDVLRRVPGGWRIAERRILPRTAPLGGLLSGRGSRGTRG